MAAESNVGRGLRFRQFVSMFLDQAGVPNNVRFVRTSKRLSELLSVTGENSDIQGVPDFLINARSEGTNRRLSHALAEARAQASLDGKTHWATVFHRPSKAPGEQYVLMELEVFARILRERAGQ